MNASPERSTSAQIVHLADFQSRKPGRREPAFTPEEFKETFDSLSPVDQEAVRGELVRLQQENAARVANSRGECNERKERRAHWNAIQIRMEFYDRLRSVFCYARLAAENGVTDARQYVDEDMKRYHTMHQEYLKAKRDLLLLPAPTIADLNWKKTVRASDRFNTRTSTPRRSTARSPTTKHG